MAKAKKKNSHLWITAGSHCTYSQIMTLMHKYTVHVEALFNYNSNLPYGLVVEIFLQMNRITPLVSSMK